MNGWKFLYMMNNFLRNAKSKTDMNFIYFIYVCIYELACLDYIN